MESTMSSHSISSSSMKLTPVKHYQHQHPVVSYASWMKNTSERVRTGMGAQTSYEAYVLYYNSEHTRMMSRVLYHFSTDETCDCYMYRSMERCYHTLNMSGQQEYQSLLIRNNPGDIQAVMLSAEVSDLQEVLASFLDGAVRCSNTLPENIWIKCSDCAGVFRTTSRDHIPRHSCSRTFRFKYGLVSEFRYELPFRTRRDEKIILDERCVFVHSGDLHLLSPVCGQVNYQIERLKLHTTTLQLCLQDPVFLKTLGAIEAYEKSFTVGAYAVYLYLQHRLLPYLESLNLEIHTEKLLPVFTMITVKDDDGSVEPAKRRSYEEAILGYTIQEEEDRVIQTIPEESREDVLTLVNTLRESPNDLTFNMLCDEIANPLTTDTGQHAIGLLNVTRPVYPALSALARRKADQGILGWTPLRDVSQWCHVNSTSLETRLHHVTNIFGIIPSESFSVPLRPALGFISAFGPRRYRARWKMSDYSPPSRVSRRITFDLT